ncbi:hypothetical protein CBFG_03003 [Clostridiales bacterium 1_7_47FAA]|nr:hypothetical protein CBFG_03003 [Clostridiales bacterium 1_7_47FAA]
MYYMHIHKKKQAPSLKKKKKSTQKAALYNIWMLYRTAVSGGTQKRPLPFPPTASQ